MVSVRQLRMKTGYEWRTASLSGYPSMADSEEIRSIFAPMVALSFQVVVIF
jgi:hypothetical protein